MDLDDLKNTPPWDWPKEAGEIFLGLLNNEQAEESDRLVASELAGDFTIINDELASALLRIVSNSEETQEMRSRAVIALGPALENADSMGFEDSDDILISESIFNMIRRSLRKLFMDADISRDVRRRILEASVRAPQDWHKEVVLDCYGSADESWRLTAVFCMNFIRGFDAQILEALSSDDSDILYQAVCAAGGWEVNAAWSRVAALVTSIDADKSLRLASIEAAASINPQGAIDLFMDLTDSDDEDIAEAAIEAQVMAEGLANIEDPDNDDLDDLFCQAGIERKLESALIAT